MLLPVYYNDVEQDHKEQKPQCVKECDINHSCPEIACVPNLLPRENPIICLKLIYSIGLPYG